MRWRLRARRSEEPVEWRRREGGTDAGAAIGSLYVVPDFRKARGRRYSIACYLTIAIAAGWLATAA